MSTITLSELSEKDKESLFKEMAEKKRINGPFFILVLLLIIFALFAFVFPDTILRRQQSATSQDQSLRWMGSDEPGKMVDRIMSAKIPIKIANPNDKKTPASH